MNMFRLKQPGNDVLMVFIYYKNDLSSIVRLSHCYNPLKIDARREKCIGIF
jgi:hypothetical protein